MNIDKSQILELLKSRGEDDKAAQADSELPDQVDTEKDGGLLANLGVNPADLLGGSGSGVGDKLGL
jgi:hypothetical protein